MRVLSTSLSLLISLSTLFKAQSQTIVEIASSDDRFDTLVELLTAADLVETLIEATGITVFAPTDEAFASVPDRFLTDDYSEHLRNILLYHVLGSEVFSTDLALNLTAATLNGETVEVTSLDPPQINGVDIVQADVNASDGVIHVIDEVLLPSAATDTIVDLAVATPELSTLTALLGAAGLVDALQGEGPFTVFAPTNAAFEQLDADTLEFLTDPANVDALTDILTYHVVGDSIILSTELVQGATVRTLNTDSITVTSLDPPTIDESLIIQADILASNGVIHLIDAVLTPPDDEDGDNDGMMMMNMGMNMMNMNMMNMGMMNMNMGMMNMNMMNMNMMNMNMMNMNMMNMNMMNMNMMQGRNMGMMNMMNMRMMNMMMMNRNNIFVPL